MSASEVEPSLPEAARGLIPTVAAEPEEDTPRGMLVDALQECGRWDWPTVIGLVKRHPAADGMRYLAADWFDQQGDAGRAEFIRVQVELANRQARRESVTGDTIRLLGRESELFGAHVGTWCPSRPQHLPRPVELRHFRRGFWSTADVGWWWWLSVGDAVLAEHPLDGGVTFVTWPNLGWLINHAERRMVVWLEAAPKRDRAITVGVAREAMGNAYRWWPKAVHDLLWATWPGVTFHLPNTTMPRVPETWAEAVQRGWGIDPASESGDTHVVSRVVRSPADVESPVARYAAQESRTQTQIREHIAQEVIIHFGCSPGDVTWVEDAFNGVNSPVHRLTCNCGAIASFRERQLVTNATFSIVTLEPFRRVAVATPAAPDIRHREWGSWAGRCDRCQRVYVAAREVVV